MYNLFSINIMIFFCNWKSIENCHLSFASHVLICCASYQWVYARNKQILSLLVYYGVDWRIIDLSNLAHLGWRLKWAFLIKICPLSVVVVGDLVGVVVVVNFSHFYLHLPNHWTNINQTWHNVSLGEGDSSLSKCRALPFSKGR